MFKLLRFTRPLAACRFWIFVVAGSMLLQGTASAQTMSNANANLPTLLNFLGNGSGPRTITMAFDGQIATTVPLEIFFDTTLDASGHSVNISGSGSTPIFLVDPGVKFTVINLVISNAKNTGANGTNGVNGNNGPNIGTAGGAGTAGSNSWGGAIFNQGDCSLFNCLLVSNSVVGGNGGAGGNGGSGSFQAGNGGSGGNGGTALGAAVYNLGTLLLSNCTVAGNSVTGGNGGSGGTNGGGSLAYPGAGGIGGLAAGSGIYNLGTARYVNCTFNQNAAQGGATQTAGGNPQGNSNGQNGNSGGFGEGGGIFNLGTNSIVNCTFFANTVTGGVGGNGGQSGPNGHGGNGGPGGSGIGGGVYTQTGGLVTITNCTFSGNAATGGAGGAVGSGVFAGGTAGSTGSASGANIANNGGTFQFKNSILNKPTNAVSAFGAIVDQGNNISSDATPTFTTTNSLNNTDPKLAAAGLTANNSSVVLTIGLNPTSPAIDKIFDSSAPPFDERGFARPVGPRSDIGAFEFGAAATNFSISGRVTVGTNAFAGVTVSAGSVSAITDSNGNYSLPLAQSNSFAIVPSPQGFFNPQSFNVFVTADQGGINFQATNAAFSLAIVNGTNTNSFPIGFTGVPNFASYRIQAATNLLPTNIVWTNIATNTSGVVTPITISVSGTNLTNFPKRFFRIVTP